MQTFVPCNYIISNKIQDSKCKIQTFVPYNYLITWRSLNFMVNNLFVVVCIVFSTWIDDLPQYESRQFFLNSSDACFW